MGRHSADDDEPVDSAELPEIGWHDIGGSPEAAGDGTGYVAGHGAGDVAVDTAAPAKARPAKREGGTHADLRMLRAHPSLRARCAAAIIVPFLLYSIVMIVIGRTDIYLIWVWVPFVAAGVILGHFLDVAHRRSSG